MIQSYNQATSNEDKLVEIGMGGFRLFAKTSETVNLKSQAPTTYLEDGSFANDHIVLEPLNLQIQGNVSNTYIEVKNQTPSQNKRKDSNSQISSLKTPRTTKQNQLLDKILSNNTDQYKKADSQINQQNILSNVGSVSQNTYAF